MCMKVEVHECLRSRYIISHKNTHANSNLLLQQITEALHLMAILGRRTRCHPDLRVLPQDLQDNLIQWVTRLRV